MGIINHNCVIATTWDGAAIDQLIDWISSLDIEYRCLFCLGESLANGYQTIVMVPDGSKEGWKTSESANEIRNQFIEKIKSFDYGDGSNPVAYVEVSFGEYGQDVVRGNNVDRYN